MIDDDGNLDNKRPLTSVLRELQRNGVLDGNGMEDGGEDGGIEWFWGEMGRVAAHTLMTISPELLNARRAFAFATPSAAKVPASSVALKLHSRPPTSTAA